MKTAVKLAILSVSLLLSFSVLVSCEKSESQDLNDTNADTSESSDTEKSSVSETESAPENSYEDIMISFDPVKDAYWAKENVVDNPSNHKSLKPGQVFIHSSVDEVTKNLPEEQYIALKIFVYKDHNKKNDYSDNEISKNPVQERIFVNQLMKIGVIRDINHSDIYYATPSMIEQITAPEGYYINICLAEYIYYSFTYSADEKRNKPASAAKEIILPDHIYNTSLVIEINDELDKLIPKDNEGNRLFESNEENEKILREHIIPIFKDKLSKAGVNIDISPEDFTYWEAIKIDITGEVALKLIDSESFYHIYGQIVQDRLLSEQMLKGRVK